MKLTGDHCQCPSCGQYFNSTYAFDYHRYGDYGKYLRKCRTLDEMRAIGMVLTNKGLWISQAKADSSAPGMGSGVLQDKAV